MVDLADLIPTRTQELIEENKVLKDRIRQMQVDLDRATTCIAGMTKQHTKEMQRVKAESEKRERDADAYWIQQSHVWDAESKANAERTADICMEAATLRKQLSDKTTELKNSLEDLATIKKILGSPAVVKASKVKPKKTKPKKANRRR